MSTDYRFVIKRKEDNKKIGEFYYNKIKNVADVSYLLTLNFDPNRFSLNRSNEFVRLEANELNDDAEAIRSMIDSLYKDIFTKQLLQTSCVSVDVKAEYDEDINSMREEISNLLYAFEAVTGLHAVISCLVEDQVVVASNDDATDSSICAYVANGKDLGDNKYVWINDIYIEVVPEY